MKRILASALVAVAALAAPVIAAPPAAGSVALSIEASCESSTASGFQTSRFFCTRTVTGAVGAVAVTWKGLSNASFASPAKATGTCVNGGYRRSAEVQATVTDSAGHTATTQTSFWCYAIAP